MSDTKRRTPVRRLSDAALDAIVDIVMVTSKRLPRRSMRARQYWLDVTSDWWYEWCDRRSHACRVCEE